MNFLGQKNFFRKKIFVGSCSVIFLKNLEPLTTTLSQRSSIQLAIFEFFVKKRQKTHFLNFLGQKIFFRKNFLLDHVQWFFFEKFRAINHYSNSKELTRLTIFLNFLFKKRVFSRFLGQNIFLKKIFAPSSREFYCKNFKLSLTYVPLSVEACSPNELAAPPAAAAAAAEPSQLLESGARTKNLAQKLKKSCFWPKTCFWVEKSQKKID